MISRSELFCDRDMRIDKDSSFSITRDYNRRKVNEMEQSRQCECVRSVKNKVRNQNYFSRASETCFSIFIVTFGKVKERGYSVVRASPVYQSPTLKEDNNTVLFYAKKEKNLDNYTIYILRMT